MTVKRVPIKKRIQDALESHGGSMGYHALMRIVFPEDQYPKAWNYQANGGPPGCAMAFGRALREMQCREWGSLSSRMVGLPEKT
jgi:hypothetical protein